MLFIPFFEIFSPSYINHIVNIISNLINSAFFCPLFPYLKYQNFRQNTHPPSKVFHREFSIPLIIKSITYFLDKTKSSPALFYLFSLYLLPISPILLFLLNCYKKNAFCEMVPMAVWLFVVCQPGAPPSPLFGKSMLSRRAAVSCAVFSLLFLALASFSCFACALLLYSVLLAVFLTFALFFGLPNFFPWLTFFLGLAMVTASVALSV